MSFDQYLLTENHSDAQPSHAGIMHLHTKETARVMRESRYLQTDAHRERALVTCSVSSCLCFIVFFCFLVCNVRWLTGDISISARLQQEMDCDKLTDQSTNLQWPHDAHLSYASCTRAYIACNSSVCCDVVSPSSCVAVFIFL